MIPTVTEIRNGIEVDLVNDFGSWSVRLAELGDRLSLVVVSHMTGRVLLAELLDRGEP